MASRRWTDKSFGERLRNERDSREWTQPQMADMLGMHATTLAKIEKGARSVRIVEAAAMADLFGVSLDSLLGRRSGLANEVADVVSNLQHTAGRAVADVMGIHSATQGWFMELGDLDFDGRQDLEVAGARALQALTQAQDALYDITRVEAPQRVAMAQLEDLIERKANKKVAEEIGKMLKNFEQEDRQE